MSSVEDPKTKYVNDMFIDNYYRVGRGVEGREEEWAGWSDPNYSVREKKNPNQSNILKGKPISIPTCLFLRLQVTLRV